MVTAETTAQNRYYVSIKSEPKFTQYCNPVSSVQQQQTNKVRRPVYTVAVARASTSPQSHQVSRLRSAPSCVLRRKGGGAAHTREKCVAAAADRFIVIVSSDKLVPALTAPLPLELLDYGLAATVRALGTVSLRDVPRSPDGGVIADWLGSLDDPASLAARLSATPGVIDHGLFSPDMTERVVVAEGTTTRHIMINA